MVNELSSRRRWGERAKRILRSCAALAIFACVASRVGHAQVCAVVKLEILQKATMERVGFDAQLGITNSLAASPLTSLQVTISIKDKNGNSADSLFFVKVGTQTNVTALDGTGVIQPQTEGKIGWLIIPSTGAGGSAPLGQTYQVKATINFIANGILQSLGTLDAPITVMPQPFLRLQYVLPRDVDGDDPQTEVVESSVPYMLGLRVVNEGYGPAKNLKVESGQPRIVSNVNGLAVNFNILGTFIGAAAISNTMLLPFGDIAAGGVKLGGWRMVSGLKGRFIDFQASFTHDPGLGGQLTSLIGGVSTYWLLKDVLDDQPGRDAQFDFLVSTQSTLSEVHPLPNLLMDSDIAQPYPVSIISSEAVALTGNLTSIEPVLQMTFTAPGTTGWYYITANDPTGGVVDLVQVVRSDNKSLNPKNFWQNSPYYKPDEGEAPDLIRILDFNPTGSYRLVFKQSSLDTAPDPVADLSGSTATFGAVRLDWTSTGEDRSSGTIYNGRYAIAYSTDPAFSFSTAAAQVQISTTVIERSSEGYALSGLLGNATYFLRLALADKKPLWSALSNAATVQTLAYPAADGAAADIEISSFTVSWSTAVNLPGTQYLVELTTGAGPLETIGFSADISSHAFTGLEPDTAYFVRATARNSSGVDSPPLVFASPVTRANKPSAVTVPIAEVEASSLAVFWSSGTNPGHTYYYVVVATGADLPAVSTVTVMGLSSAAITGLMPDTEYFFSVKSVNGSGVETASLSLGSTVTAAAFPAGLSFSEVAPSSVTAAWGASSPDNPPYTNYLLEVSTAQDFTGDILSSATVRAAGRALISSLAGNTTYYARVTAANQIGRARVEAVPGQAYTASVAVPGASPGFLAVGVSSASAAWDPSGNGPGVEFVLQLSTDPAFAGVVSSSVTLLSTASVSGLLSDTTYYARVKARAGQSESAYAGLGSTRTLADIPGAPPDPFVEVGTSALSAAWFYNGAAQGFRLEVSTISDFSSAVVVSSQTADPGARSLSVTELLAGTTYYARAGALGGQGSYSYSALGSTRTYYPAPQEGTSLLALDSSTVRAAWTGGVTGEGVVYTVDASSDDFAGAVVSSAATGLSAEVTGLLADTSYKFRVRASTSNYYSRYTDLGSIPTLAPKPAAAQNTVLAAGPDTLSIAWAAASSGSGYLLEVSTDQAFAGVLFSSSTSDLAQSTLTVSGLTPNTTYYARAAGINLEGAANYSALGSTLTAARAPAASGFISVTSASLSAVWTGADNPSGTGFTVQLSTDSFASLNASVSTEAVSRDFTGLTPNTLYSARVRAANFAGVVTDWTDLASTTTLSDIPSAGVVDSVTESTIAVSWTAGLNPAGTVFTAQLSQNDFASVQASSATVAASAVFSGLSANTTYYLRVRSANSAGTATDFAVIGSTATPAVKPSTAAYTGVGDSFLRANWLAAGNPGGTVYELELTSDAYSTLTASTRTTAVSYLFSGLEPQIAYEARVRAAGHNGLNTAYADLGSTTTYADQPLALAFSGVFVSSLTANWDANGNTGGTVFLCQLSTNSFSSVYASSETVGTSADFAVAGANTVYSARVQVKDAAIFTPLGSTSTWAAAPVFSYSAALSAGSMRANWLAGGNSGGTSYEAEISTDGFATVNETLSTANLFQVFTGLSANRAYDLRVRALGASGPPSSFTTLGSSVTYAVQPATAAITDVTATALRLVWGNNGNPSGTRYLAQLSTNSFTSVYAASDTANVNAYFTGLSAAAAYSGRVQAVNSSGAATSFTSLGSTTTLGVMPPDSPYFSAVGSTSVSAAWSDNGNQAGTVYLLQLSTDSFATLSGSSQTLSTAAFFTELTPNTSYTARVSAGGGGPVSVGSTVTLAALPGVPVYSAVTSTAITASWSADDNPQGTEYLVRLSTDGFASIAASSRTADSSALFQYLTPNTTYAAQVRAYNSAEIFTAFIAAASTATLSEKVAGSQIGAVWITSAAVNWLPLSIEPSSHAAAGYLLQASTMPSFVPLWSSSGTADLALSTLAISGLTGGNTYYFRAASLNLDGTPNYAVEVSTELEVVLALSLSSAAYAYGEVYLNTSTTSLSEIEVENRGNVDVDFSIQGGTATPGSQWAVWDSTETAPAHNKLLLRAVFNDTRPELGNYGDEDLVTGAFRPSQDVAGGGRYTVGDAQTGLLVPPGARRKIWFRLDMPSTSYSIQPQALRFVIQAGQP